MEHAALLFVGGFVLYGLVLFFNGTLDSSPPMEAASEIVDIGGGEVELWGFLPYSWGSLRSWRREGGTERIFLTRTERSRAWPGQAILVKVRKGYLGIPWVSALERDQEKYARRVLEIAPTAAGPRKNLIRFYLERRRWKEAAAAGQEYLQLYPNDYDFISGVAAALGVARQDAEALSLLEPFVARQPNYELLNMVGWMLHRAGQSARGIALLESSIPLDPDSWWAYYHLGYAYRDVGRLEDAVAMFQKVLERRPNYPEIEQQLQFLRRRMRQPTAPPKR
jgi:tetratricopeptide (TPR) repeat protein